MSKQIAKHLFIKNATQFRNAQNYNQANRIVLFRMLSNVSFFPVTCPKGYIVHVFKIFVPINELIISSDQFLNRFNRVDYFDYNFFYYQIKVQIKNAISVYKIIFLQYFIKTLHQII